MKNFIIILFSIVAGVANGMFSTGAGLILIPILVLLLKYNNLVSRGTVIFVIFVLCIINIIIYSHQYEFVVESIYIIVGCFIGSIIGAKIVGKINKNFLSVSFAVFTIIMGVGLIQ